MEELDPTKLARVWNRVRGQKNPDDLPQMMELAHRAALHSRTLSKKFASPRHRFLIRMAQQNQAAVHSLLGICRLNGFNHCVLPPKIPVAPARQQILDCYTCMLQLATLCDGYTGHPQFGHLYSRLGNQYRAHCQQLLQLLGMQN